MKFKTSRKYGCCAILLGVASCLCRLASEDIEKLIRRNC